MQLLANNGLKFDLSRALRSVVWVGAFFIIPPLAVLPAIGECRSNPKQYNFALT